LLLYCIFSDGREYPAIQFIIPIVRKFNLWHFSFSRAIGRTSRSPSSKNIPAIHGIDHSTAWYHPRRGENSDNTGMFRNSQSDTVQPFSQQHVSSAYYTLRFKESGKSTVRHWPTVQHGSTQAHHTATRHGGTGQPASNRTSQSL
jgi:hypothetical protein